MSNVLETSLVMLGIEKYIKEFRAFGVDATVLSLLTDNDLKILGIDDEELRIRIIRQFSSLPVSNDDNIDMTVNYKYMMKVLNNIDHHLLLLNASLSYAYHNKNIKATDIKLKQPILSLISCAESIEKRTNVLYQKIGPVVEEKSYKWKYFTGIVITVGAIYTVKKCIK